MNTVQIWKDGQKMLKEILFSKEAKEEDNLTSDMEGELYNNQHCITQIHDYINPLILLGKVIKQKNS